MRRLRIRFWEWVFQSAMRLTNWALVRRSRACGCAPCVHVARLTLLLSKGGMATLPASVAATHDRARVN